MISINVYDDQREIKQHGTYAFPVAVYHYVMSDCVMGYINWHWHEEIQLSLVTKGAIRFYADGQQYLVLEGDGFFINSGRLHMAKPEGDPDSSYLCLDFHPRLLSSFEGSVFEEKYVRPYISGAQISHRLLDSRHAGQRRILKALQRIGDLYSEADFGYELKIRSVIDELWIELLEDSDLSVSQIAYESGFSSASYYIESFRKELHQTPLQYRKAGG